MRKIRVLLSMLILMTGAAVAAGADTPIATATEVIYSAIGLDHNRFNPAAGQTLTVTGLRPDHGQVTVVIYTSTGTRLREVWNQPVISGQQPVWDGRNAGGTLVASGRYIVTVTGRMLNKRLRVAVVK